MEMDDLGCLLKAWSGTVKPENVVSTNDTGPETDPTA